MYFLGYIYLMLLSLYIGCAERLNKQIYSSMPATACFRRLNGTHQAGCTSSDNGAVGVVNWVKNVSDATWIVSSGPAGPYIALVETQLFQSVMEIFLDQPDNIAGVLLYESESTSTATLSPDSQCPNKYSSALNDTCGLNGAVWNPAGSDLLHRDIPFPIFYVPPSDKNKIDEITDCFARFNEEDRDNHAGRPLCSLQLNSFMFAAVNSEVCMRRSSVTAYMNPTKMCDPLGDRNVYYSLFPRANSTKETNGSVTFVTARIDSASLFDGLSPGAATSVVGLVTLLATATTLSQLITDDIQKDHKQNIVWTLFSGESFDYIGSQRVAYDMAAGNWPPFAPLSPSSIDLHVELGQLGGGLKDNSSVVWPISAYSPDYGTMPAEISFFINTMNITLTPSASIPPSSLHSFRRILGSSGLYEVVIVDHKETFTNHFYQSVMDRDHNIGYKYLNISIDNSGNFVDADVLIANGTLKESDSQMKIAHLSATLAKVLYQKVAGKAFDGEVKPPAHLVDELLHCFLQSRVCRLLTAADFGPEDSSSEPSDDLPTEAFPMYVGPWGWGTGAPLAAGHLLALLAGKPLNESRKECADREDSQFSFFWLAGWNKEGICMQTTVNFTEALSPAFIIDNYDYSSGMYSTWTESIWRSTSARLFVAAGGGGWRAAALSGAGSTLLALVLTYWLRRHTNTIFVQNSSAGVTNDATGILRTVNC